MPDITWFDEKGRNPDWGLQKKLLALRIDGSEAPLEQDRDENDYYILFNASEKARIFVVAPPRADMYWHRLIDTSLPPPNDFSYPPGTEPRISPVSRYTVQSRSMVVLISY
jgi:glycogen operon protein